MVLVAAHQYALLLIDQTHSYGTRLGRERLRCDFRGQRQRALSRLKAPDVTGLLTIG